MNLDWDTAAAGLVNGPLRSGTAVREGYNERRIEGKHRVVTTMTRSLAEVVPERLDKGRMEPLRIGLTTCDHVGPARASVDHNGGGW